MLDMATLPLKSSHKEQPSVIHLLWAKGLSANAVWDASSIWWQVFHKTSNTRLVQKFAHGQESVVDLVAVLFRRPMQWSQRSIPSCGQNSTWWYKCLHEFEWHVEKWNINIWHLNMFACWTCSLFSLNSQYCSTLWVAKENCWAKYCTDWLRSKYKWHHSNDVIIIKITLYVPN